MNNDVRYFWRVNATNVGGTSQYSTAWNFSTIVALPAIPTLLSPDDTSKNASLSPTLRWNPGDGATFYHLQVSSTSAFTTNVVDDTTLTGTQSTIGPLDLAKTYYWRVRAKNVVGYSAFSVT
ncbi:MAG: fibronectin type III domain-containing protein, partial [Ignavibacteriales bacterium]|nr:fibronectin type III domain-containing protein [Ignavibacteriales bacterium]